MDMRSPHAHHSSKWFYVSQARQEGASGADRLLRPKEEKQYESADVKGRALLKTAAHKAQNQAKQRESFAQCVSGNVTALPVA
jgi:outer membrane protein assembly factor BamE (lipoprotein component of BamABCDE complex)